MPLATSVHLFGRLGQRAVEQPQHDLELFAVGGGGVGDDAGLLELDALVDEHGGVATVVEDHVGPLDLGPGQRLLGAPPVLLERLALPGEDRHPSGCSTVPSGPTTMAAAAWSCVEKMLQLAQRTSAPSAVKRLDEHGGLHGHVQRAGDARTRQRLAVGVLAADRHQAGHLVLGQPDLLAAELGQ